MKFFVGGEDNQNYKRSRARDVKRDFKCPLKGCDKSYG